MDLPTFLKANDLLQTAVNAGIAKHHKLDELPLKIFSREQGSGSPFTGYIKKGNWYYKARGKGVAVNVSAVKLNGKFQSLLADFEYKKECKAKLKKALLEKLKSKMAHAIEESTLLKKQLTETRNLLEKIEERYAIGEINRGIYEKFAAKHEAEILKIEGELKGKSV